MVCLGLLMLSTYRYPPSAGVMSKCSSHYQCTIFFPLRNDSSIFPSTGSVTVACFARSPAMGQFKSPKAGGKRKALRYELLYIGFCNRSSFMGSKGIYIP